MARISPVSLTGNGELKTTRVSEAELRDRLEASRNHIGKRVAHARRASGRCGPARSAGRRPGGGGMGGPRCGRPQRGEGAAASPFQKLRGVVEGAIKFVLAKRCDHGGMRWIKERVQAVTQLRCIVVNGVGKPSSALSTSDNASPPSSTLRHRVSSSLRPTSYVTLLEDGHEPICTQVEPGPPGPGARRAQGMVSDEPGPRKSSGKKPA